MGLFGSKPSGAPQSERWGRNADGAATGQPEVQREGAAAGSEDDKAIARYRYLLNTAPPEAIEQAHAEAFAQLTPEQRRLVLQQIAQVTPAAERPVLERSANDPQALARAATRAEMRQPGVLERVFGAGAAPGFGSMMAGSLLGSVAGTVLGSMIAREFFTHQPAPDLFGDSAHHNVASADDLGATDTDAGGDFGPDPGIGGEFDSGSFEV